MKKYIITAKENNCILAMGESLSVQENGNWLLANAYIAIPNTFSYAYDANGRLAESTNAEEFAKNLGDPIEIPTGVEPAKWCYTVEDGFYLNPDYEEESE